MKRLDNLHIRRLFELLHANEVSVCWKDFLCICTKSNDDVMVVSPNKASIPP
jgi:hypothetical protein